MKRWPLVHLGLIRSATGFTGHAAMTATGLCPFEIRRNRTDGVAGGAESQSARLSGDWHATRAGENTSLTQGPVLFNMLPVS